jgi:hypothetical protein
VNPAQRHFIETLNFYHGIYMGERGTEAERLTARIVRNIDRPNRRRRYLSTHQEPSIDGYIDFAHDERNPR